MANGVFHSGLQRILNLDREDLGLGKEWPGLSELRGSLLLPVAERDRELLNWASTPTTSTSYASCTSSPPCRIVALRSAVCGFRAKACPPRRKAAYRR